MTIKIEENTKDDQIRSLKEVKNDQIILDLENISFLASKDISRILIVVKNGIKVSFINANDHIKETIDVLNLEDYIQVS